MKDFYQSVYSVSMDDMMEIWIETFHPFATVLVIWDVRTHFETLQELGILIKPVEAYDSKAVTVELPGIMEAYEVLDNIEKAGIVPVMQVYQRGNLVSDNVEP